MPFDIRGKIAQRAITAVQYALIKARGDGNCLFHAAGHLLERAGVLEPQYNTHLTFRAHVVDYVRQHAKDTNALGFKLRDGLGITRNQQNAVTEAQGRQIDQRVAYLARPNMWADESCITAIERLYNVEALLYDNAGADQNAFGVRHYVPSHSPATKLRLCIQFVGSAPYHYDLYLPDAQYSAALDGPDHTAVVVPEEPKPSSDPEPQPKKPALPKKPPPAQWDYFLDPDGLKPYGPPISHRQFAYTAAWLDGKGSGSKSKKPMPVSLGGGSNVSLGPPAPVVSVQLVNRGKSKELASTSFSTATAKDAFAVGHREKFFMPLQRQDGLCVDILDPSATELVIEVEEGKARQPGTLYGAFFQRAHGKRSSKGSKGAEDVPVADFVLELSGMEGKKVESEAGARMRYVVPAKTVIDVRLAKFLVWDGSPYQLVVSSAEELTPAASAWTHFHVPSEWDVNVAEALGPAQVLMLNEDLQPLVDAGIGAKAQALANPNLEGEKPAGRETFELSIEAEAALRKLLQAAGMDIDWNAGNYLVESEAGYYVSTSWASMVHLFRNDEDGHYYMDALYCSGDVRRAYRATMAAMASAGERQEAGQVYVKPLEAVGDVRRRVGDYAGLVHKLRWSLEPSTEVFKEYMEAEQSLKGGLFVHGQIGLKMKPGDIAKVVAAQMQERHPALCARYEKAKKEREEAIRDQRADCERRWREANQAIAALHDNGELLSFLAEESINFKLEPSVPWEIERLDHTETEANQVRLSLDEIYNALTDGRKRVTSEGLVEPVTAMVEGVKDFDTGGKPLGKGADWKQFLFKPALRVTHAVTAGISSCAGGVTISTEKVPAHVFLWHVDGNLSIPLRPELERLWPGGKGMPDLRSVVSVNPSPWELNKYRPENLYPADTLDRCQTVYLPRSCHFYASYPVVAGGDRFGVDVSGDAVTLAFTYDFDKRAEPLTQWRDPEDADLPEILLDFGVDLYGAYRDQEAEIEDPKALAKYINDVLTGAPSERNAIKRRKRETANKSCRVPAFTAASFETLAGACSAFLQAECFHAGEKGDQEISAARSTRWVPGSLEG